MNNYEECVTCKQCMRDFRRKQVKNQNRQFILIFSIMLIVFGYLIWKVNRNIERDMETFQMHKPVFIEVSPKPYQIYINDDKADVQVENIYYNNSLMELPIAQTEEVIIGE